MLDKGYVNEFIERLRSEKEKSGLSYSTIAELTEQNHEAVSISTIKRIFNGDCPNSRIETLHSIARAMNVTAPNEERVTKMSADIRYMSAALDQANERIENLLAELETKNMHIERFDKHYHMKERQLAVTTFFLVVILFVAVISLSLIGFCHFHGFII